MERSRKLNRVQGVKSICLNYRPRRLRRSDAKAAQSPWRARRGAQVEAIRKGADVIKTNVGLIEVR